MEKPDEATPQEQISLKVQLEPFFSANKLSEAIEQNDSLLIGRPWNDESLRLRVTQDAMGTGLISSLNSVYLPPTYCGIWHTDTKDMEFIWNPLSKDKDLVGRRFEFHYDKRIIKCEWATPSIDLVRIALAANAVDTVFSLTDYRNLLDLKRGLMYLALNQNATPATIGPPLSFWIRNIEWEDGYVRQLCQHINFYMRYYDRGTPIVIVIEDMPTSQEVNIPRYSHGTFPSKLTGFSLDPEMLDLWHTAITSPDAIRRFLHGYQILEYFAHYYVSDKILDQVRKLILKPDTISRVDDVIAKIISVMTPALENDATKLQGILTEYVEPEAAWEIIDQYRSIFGSQILFDGGFIQEPLIGPNDKLDNFKSSWPGRFTKALENIRNHVAHAREKRHDTRIAPTLATQDRLRPWAEVTLRVAEELMIYQKQ